MFILAIDQSTAGTKALVFASDGRIIERCDTPHRQITNDHGWVEHDPEEIWRNTLKVCRQVLAKSGIASSQIAAVAIANQRETAVCWDRLSGQPVYNAIVWQCGRAADIVARLTESGAAPLVRKRTGLHLSPFFFCCQVCLDSRKYNGCSGLTVSGPAMLRQH